ncbi:MAG TPA: DUF424 family protein [archaeon]|nr:DUF424 family protein [archaeon]
MIETVRRKTVGKKNAGKKTAEENIEKKFWARVFATQHNLVLAVCDEELIEKELKMRQEGKKEVLKIKVSKNFYGGMLVNEIVVVRLMRKATIGNFMGMRAVDIAEKNGFIVKENIILIDEVPHAQFVKLSEVR